jgi:hypothetical protein
MFKVGLLILVLFICAWPITAPCRSGDDPLDPFSPTGLDRIEDKMSALVISVQGISENVALGKQEISAIGKSFEKEQVKNEKLHDSVLDIKDRVVVVEIASSANASKILSMETKFFSFLSLLIGGVITAVAAYFKSKATERNTEQAKRIADAQEKSKHN